MWENIEVTGVGRPVLLPHETSILVENNVGIYQGKYKAAGYQDGRLYLTSHRICYIDSTSPRTNSIGLYLSTVRDTEYYGGFLKSSPKITLILKPEQAGGEDSNSSKSSTPLPASTMGTATWICQICYYANVLKDYKEGDDLPKCLTCGIQAEQKQVDEAIATVSKAPSPQPQPKSQSQSQLQSSSQPRPVVTTGDGFPCPRCTFNNHPQLTQCEMCGERLISPRLPPELATTRANSPGPSLPLVPGTDNSIVKLSFRGGNNSEKKFYESMKNALRTRQWLKDYNHSSKGPSDAAGGIRGAATTNSNGPKKTSIGPGLHGLQQINEQNRQNTEQVLGNALEDLTTLMNSAKEVIKLAESYALHLEREEQQDSSLSTRKALRESSEALGLSSTIVTKEMSHDQELFHEELARQIAEFLDTNGILYKEGGVISLVDLFAIYNRARGISLISPKDLHAACCQLERLKLPIRLRKFKSGLLVVQESYRTSQVVIRNLLSWMRNNEDATENGVTAQDTSSKFGWSVTVAVEELEMAEQHGALCRDEQITGVRFFENRIVV